MFIHEIQLFGQTIIKKVMINEIFYLYFGFLREEGVFPC